MVIAFQTDMTRVVTLHDGARRQQPQLPLNRRLRRPPLRHAPPERSGKDRQDQKIDELHVKTFAYLLDRLKATPDGDGTLLDHSMILYGSSIRDGNAHTHHDLPLVLVGGAAGRSRAAVTSAMQPETPMNNLLLTMLDKAGVPAETLGDSTGQTGPALGRLEAMRAGLFANAASRCRAARVRSRGRRSAPHRRGQGSRPQSRRMRCSTSHADVNTAQPDGATPLAWAVYLDQADTVDALLKAGAKVNTADEYGETPLTLACATGNAAIDRETAEGGRGRQRRALERRNRADDRRAFRHAAGRQSCCWRTARRSMPWNHAKARTR